MAPFHVPVQFMLDAGRLAYGAALAVPPVLSRLAMLERYYRDRSVGLPARWTPAEAHDNAVANLPATVRAVAASLLVDRLTVIDRDGGVLYDGADPEPRRLGLEPATGGTRPRTPPTARVRRAPRMWSA